MPDVLGRPCRRDHPTGIDGHKLYRAEKDEWMKNQNRGAVHIIETSERVVYVDRPSPDPLSEVLARPETAQANIKANKAEQSPEQILAEAPDDIREMFDEYRRENEPFGTTQERIATDWQALATRFGDDGKALEPLTDAERIKMHNLGRAVDWGKTRVIEVIGI